MVRWLASTILIALLFALDAGAARLDPLPYGSRLDTHLDFREDDTPVLTLRLSIPHRQLVFKRDDDGYRAKLRTVVNLLDRKSGEDRSLVFHEQIELPDFKSSRDPETRFETEYELEIDSGKLQVEVLIYGRGNYLPWREEFQLDLPVAGQRSFFIQGPRFDAAGLAPITPPFGFHNPWSIPPRHSLFLDGFAMDLPMRAELRVWEAGEDLEAILGIEGRDGRTVHYERRMLPGDPGSRILRFNLPVEDLSMGPHRVSLSISRRGESREIQGLLEMGFGPAAFGRDWQETLDLLAYRASDEDLALMEAAEPARRLGAYREFWERQDNSPGGENPALERFFQDLDHVGRNFGTPWLPGTRSDRGRVYLEYGPPQQVDQVSEDSGYRAREVWSYSNGLVFVFEDRHGHGEFELVERWSQ